MEMEGGESSNIEDRRGESVGGYGGMGGGGFGGMPIPIGTGGGGLFRGGLGLVAVVVMAMIFGVDPLALLGGGGGGTSYVPQSPPPRTGTRPPAGDAEAQFVSRVLRSTEEVWAEQFRRAGKEYRQPRLVLFRDATQTQCGMGQAAMGPFYCPPDQRIYLDLSFFEELASRFRAPGQFPQAYVIAHEVGHHVQTLLGISNRVQQMRQSMSKRDGNALSVRAELQADCFAGVWAHHASKERGGTVVFTDRDVEQALAAAAAIGDDRLQRQSQGRVVPDSFTHGTSEQRQRWFRAGLASGDVNRCDTFRAQQI